MRTARILVLLLPALLAPSARPDVCSACAPGAPCRVHLEREAAELPRLREELERAILAARAERDKDPLRQRAGDGAGDAIGAEATADPGARTGPGERIALVESIAALASERENSPSRAVTTALALALADPDVEVRRAAARALGRGQDAAVAEAELARALDNSRAQLAWIGPASPLRAIDPRLVREGLGAPELLRELAGRVRALGEERAAILERLRVSPAPAVEPLKYGKSEKEYEEALREYERAQERLAEQRVEYARLEEQAVALGQRVLEARAGEAGLRAALDALSLAPDLLAALAAVPGDRGAAAARAYFEEALLRAPSHASPAAETLGVLGRRDGTEALVRALERAAGAEPKEIPGSVDVARAGAEDPRQAADAALRAVAHGRGLDAPKPRGDPPDWSALAAAWRAWLEQHAERLPERIGPDAGRGG